MKFNTYFLEIYRDIVFPVIVIDHDNLYGATDMARLQKILVRCKKPWDRFITFIDATGYEFLFEPPVLALVPNVLRQDFPWKKKEIIELYESSANRPGEIPDRRKLMRKSIAEIIIHLADLIKDNRPSLTGRLARPFRTHRPFDPFPG